MTQLQRKYHKTKTTDHRVEKAHVPRKPRPQAPQKHQNNPHRWHEPTAMVPQSEIPHGEQKLAPAKDATFSTSPIRNAPSPVRMPTNSTKYDHSNRTPIPPPLRNILGRIPKYLMLSSYCEYFLKEKRYKNPPLQSTLHHR